MLTTRAALAPTATAQTSGRATTSFSTATPLRIATEPRPRDWRLLVHVAPDAPLGFCEVLLAQGRGCRGRGRRPLDDARTYADALRHIAQHLLAYATDYERAALEDAEDDEQQAALVLTPAPQQPTLQPCASCGTLSPWPACAECEPF
jgi:hypothetical protein